MRSHANTIDAFLYYFFGDTSQESFQEFKEFWMSLSTEEKVYYRSIDLKTGLPCVQQVCVLGWGDRHDVDYIKSA